MTTFFEPKTPFFSTTSGAGAVLVEGLRLKKAMCCWFDELWEVSGYDDDRGVERREETQELVSSRRPVLEESSNLGDATC